MKMGEAIELSQNDGQNLGDSCTSQSTDENKRQTSAIAMTTTTLSKEPPCKKQRVEGASQNSGSENMDRENQQQKHQPYKREGKKTSAKKVKSKHMDPNVLRVRKTIQEACRTNNLSLAMNAYEEALKEGFRVEAQSYYNLLNLCDGLDRDERKVHVGTPKVPPPHNSTNPEPTNGNTRKDNAKIDSKQRQIYVFAIKERMQSKEVNLPLNETAYSAIVKLLSKNKEFQKAEEILEEAEGVQQCKPKLRLYASLLHAYCEDQKLIGALRCWKRLRQRGHAIQKQKVAKNRKENDGSTWALVLDGMDVTEREYLSLMQCAVQTFQEGPNYVDGSDLVIEDALTRLAEDIPVPAKDTVSTIMEWFEIQNKNTNNNNNSAPSNTRNTEPPDTSSSRAVIQELLNDIRSLDAISEPSPRMGPVYHTDAGTWEISKGCSINGVTGELLDGCLKGHKLHPVPLSNQSFLDMTIMNESIVRVGNIKGNAHCKFQGGRKGKKRKDFSPEDRRIEWERFNRFLEKQVAKGSVESEPKNFEVVIDGANVGYFKQNFSTSPNHVDYERIDSVVRHFTEKLGKKVLLVMHSRHFSRFMCPQKYRGLTDAWKNEGILYKTPPGMNDDWFWMHAALKYKTLVVTNDEMRDHHFQMLAPKFFLRWKERHQVHFDFGTWERDSIDNDNSKHIELRGPSGRPPFKVLLTYPNAYSRRIQRVADGLVVPLTKRGDENRFLDG